MQNDIYITIMCAYIYMLAYTHTYVYIQLYIHKSFGILCYYINVSLFPLHFTDPGYSSGGD